MGLSLTACAGPAQEPEPAPEPTPTPAPAPSSQDDGTQIVATPYLDLGIDLMETLADEQGNSLVSPISLAQCLALASNGAEGATASQILALLGQQDNASLNRDLKALSASWEGQDVFSSADSVWVRDGFSLAKTYEGTVTDELDAEVYVRPFDDSTVAEVNEWVSKATHGMIEKLLDSIDAQAAMYLIDGCAFEGTWAETFSEHQLIDATFTTESGAAQDATLMYDDEDHCTYLEGEGFTGFAKPYDGDRFAFVGLLPSEGTSLSDFLAALTGEELSRAIDEASTPTTLTCAMPKFSGSYSMELKDALESLGVTDCFDPVAADFSPMVEGSSAGDLVVSSILQKTFIEVSEEGTRAAAVTSTQVEATALPAPDEVKEVVLDRPFAYLILDTESSVPLFMGTVGALSEA